MDLNSPVKMMLPQEVNTPLVPDSEMYTENSTVGSAVGKRKAGPDALSAADAKKIATYCDASTEEDETPLEGYGLPEGHLVLNVVAEDYELRTLAYTYDATADDGFKGLEDVVARDYRRGSLEFNNQVKVLKEAQYSTVGKPKNCRKLAVKVHLNKEGRVVGGRYHFIK